MFFGKINRFLRDLNASILPIFALMAVPMILVAGMAADVARHHNTNEHVQMALDSAGLAAARHARINLATPSDTLNAEIKEIAQNYFDAALKSRDELSMQELTVTRKGPKLLLSAKGELPTSFMRMTGKTTLEVDTKSEIVIGEPTSVEIALVLDMSFSMIGTRLSALQTGASGLVDTLVDPTSDKVKVSIVPFGQYVNVGKKNRNKSWIDVPANERIVNQHCRIDPAYLDRICTWKWVKCVKDGLQRRCRQRTDCDQSRMANAPKICRDTVTQWKWFGCVRSRKIPWDVRDLKYGTHPVEGFLSVSDKVYSRAYNQNLIHQVLISYMTNSRQGTTSQKQDQHLKYTCIATTLHLCKMVLESLTQPTPVQHQSLTLSIPQNVRHYQPSGLH